MQKIIAESLRDKVLEVEKLEQQILVAQANFSNPDRDFNFNKGTMKFAKCVPLSEHAAAVVYKQDSGVYSVFFFYYMRMNGGCWRYFAPTDSHILAFENFGRIKQRLEEVNYETKTT